ncbi:MAG: DUF4131 domain-containing protein [Clostridiales bacterium]|nr:DUF4131 domain-containing protein [Clostridiales bacterium]
MTHRDYAWLAPVAALALAAGIWIGRSAAGWLVFIPLLLCAAAACWLLRWPQRFAAVQAVVLAVGCLLGYAAYHPSLPREGEYTVSGVVAEEIRLREDGQVRTLLRGVRLNGQSLLSGAYWSFYLREGETLPEGLAPGCSVTLTARVYHPSPASNPGGYDFREYLLQKNVTIGVYGVEELHTADGWHPLGIAAAIRHSLTQGLISAMGETAGGYASTMLLGSQHLIPDEDRQAFSRLGIAHILSVSGFHVSVLAGLVNWLFRRLRLSRKARFWSSGALLAFYCLLAGLSAPVIRAALLFLLYEFGALRHRQRSSLHLLCVSFLAQLLVSPVQLTSMSFHLTYGAMLGLTLVTPWLCSLWEPRRFRRVWSTLCAALGAQVGVLLPGLYWFQELPVLGILLNTVVLGAATGLIILCWVVLFLLPVPALATFVGQLTAGLMNGMLVAVGEMSSWPGITIWTCQGGLLTAAAWAALLLAMSWWWPGRRRWLGLVLSVVVLAASVYPWPDTGSRYVQLSVGEADAAVLQDQGYHVAIDTGEDGEELAGYLHQRRISLDALVLTHLHTDHAGGVAELMSRDIPIKTCYLPWDALETQADEDVMDMLAELAASGTELVELGRGERIELPNGSITVLWPEAGKVRQEQEANESSLTLLAEVRGSTLLLTGDLSGTYEMYAAAPADVLKAAHHGSENSTSQEFLQAVAPEMLILSCGDEARSLSMEERRGDIPMADTRRDGCITIEFQTDGFNVETMW